MIIDHIYILGQYFAHGGTDQGMADAIYLHFREAERAAEQRFERRWCLTQANNDACKKYAPSAAPQTAAASAATRP